MLERRRPLQPWAPGQELKATRLQALNDGVTDLQTAILASPIADHGLSVVGAQQFRYKSTSGDYIVCRTWDGTNEGATDVCIAKPYTLRPSVTARAGHTFSYADDFSRTADGTESQVIEPTYAVNDVIFACRVILGTGVTGAEWLDINVDGRQWAVST